MIGVKLLSLTLTKCDGSSVPVSLPATPTSLNLAQLDNLGEILSSVALTPRDTYTGATLTISANQGDVTLITSPDPETGFPAAAAGEYRIKYPYSLIYGFRPLLFG